MLLYVTGENLNEKLLNLKYLKCRIPVFIFNLLFIFIASYFLFNLFINLFGKFWVTNCNSFETTMRRITKCLEVFLFFQKGVNKVK